MKLSLTLIILSIVLTSIQTNSLSKRGNAPNYETARANITMEKTYSNNQKDIFYYNSRKMVNYMSKDKHEDDLVYKNNKLNDQYNFHIGICDSEMIHKAFVTKPFKAGWFGRHFETSHKLQCRNDNKLVKIHVPYVFMTTNIDDALDKSRKIEIEKPGLEKAHNLLLKIEFEISKDAFTLHNRIEDNIKMAKFTIGMKFLEYLVVKLF